MNENTPSSSSLITPEERADFDASIQRSAAERRAEHAIRSQSSQKLAAVRDAGDPPPTHTKFVKVNWGGDDWTQNYGRSFPATTTDEAAVSSALEELQEKVRAGEIKPGRVKSVKVIDA
ncbi:hypothetical protein WMF20_35500 [Sorangium sp. So ce834]|uniref:hypothetical protein n=1 Tax=Sorangium sp. So ce834 TaxID=3133321 RepID=UPI003F5DCBA5